ncbi:hypothetical protein SAMN05216228_104923 [Rhizobium tibeticum]|uniref:Uncharacterized protein n=1 Tax=Rhizobium tibeticum TaxID=501024 RepID=A0A1H8VYD1_9HYPH|nr:hypothetical protein RTCCBAU85039_6225 [Rhizobium tibeticum]SEP20462.1 hypothetical protein SAMN05216228_104923 [Rhizobium tibeticum]
MRRRFPTHRGAMVSSWVRRADIFRGVVQDEVLEMDELAVDPQRGAGIGEMRWFVSVAPTRKRPLR